MVIWKPPSPVKRTSSVGAPTQRHGCRQAEAHVRGPDVINERAIQPDKLGCKLLMLADIDTTIGFCF